jgi:catechol 2,3-dioxygenase-like lactoylglutathione lyase family enzyme
MVEQFIPKLPAKDINETKQFYVDTMSFELVVQFDDYIIFAKDGSEIHFYLDRNVEPKTSEMMIYIRVSGDLEALYKSYKDRDVVIPEKGMLEVKPWGQQEFSIIDNNGTLLTFGQTVSE